MLEAVLLDARVLVPGEGDLAEDLLSGRRRQGRIELRRLPTIAGGSWRRMSRLSRMVATAAADLAAEDVPVVFGTAIGEIVPTTRFQDRLYTEGPDRASPLAFQNSVYNAPAGHLSIALGLRSLSETVAAGGATGLSALLRGMTLLRQHDEVLVIAADDDNEHIAAACATNGLPAPGEAVAAVRIGRAGEGPRIRLGAGVDGDAILTRRTRLPREQALASAPGAPIEACLGICLSSGLAALLALRHRGGCVVDLDGRSALSARICL
ncbi:MAG TPA: beta-ketoacyl synthase chain length factor [Myxococcota bacterium]|nr:beta-ketoacyl synthase chain length factor [Myxococcota bacterium]